jgi:hypothetical protein
MGTVFEITVGDMNVVSFMRDCDGVADTEALVTDCEFVILDVSVLLLTGDLDVAVDEEILMITCEIVGADINVLLLTELFERLVRIVEVSGDVEAGVLFREFTPVDVSELLLTGDLDGVMEEELLMTACEYVAADVKVLSRM